MKCVKGNIIILREKKKPQTVLYIDTHWKEDGRRGKMQQQQQQQKQRRHRTVTRATCTVLIHQDYVEYSKI